MKQEQMKKAKRIAILTSGGDAPGMNAAVRGVVRAALNKGWEVYAIKEGYRGLLTGGEHIFTLDWVDVSWNFREGGTFLGSARHPELKGEGSKARTLKEQALLLNLKKLDISSLVVVGGDGSLTGGYALFKMLQNKEFTAHGLNKLLSVLGKSFECGQKADIIVRADGARFSTNFLKETIDVLLKPAREVRETVLGHLRRGANPTVFERTLATRLGVKAIDGAGITLDVTVVPLETSLGGIIPTAFDRILAKRAGGRRLGSITAEAISCSVGENNKP
jgi:6-phosphofructokinase